MKTIVLFAFLGLFCSHALAQYDGASVTVNGRTYKCDKLGGVGTSMFLENTANPVFTEFAYAHEDCIVPKGNYQIVKEKINATFSEQRRAELANEQISIWIFIKPSTGNVISVCFLMRTTSLITPQEIYTLENHIKTLNFPQNTLCHSMPFIRYPAKVLWN